MAGAGKMGRHLAWDLAERGHEVTLIEQETGAASRARRELPYGTTIALEIRLRIIDFPLDAAKSMEASWVRTPARSLMT